MNLDRRLLALARDKRITFALTVLAGFLGGILTIAQAHTLSITVNDVFIGGKNLQGVANLLRALLFIIAGRAFLVWLGELSAKHLAIRIKEDLRNRLFAHILDLGPGFTRAERTGELTAAATEGIEALDAYFSEYLPQLALSALVPLSVLLFVFPLDPLSGLILLLTAPLIPIFMILIGKGAEKITNRQYKTLSRLSAHFLDSLQGLTTLKEFGQSKAHAHKIRAVSEEFSDATMKVLRVTFLSALVLELIATLSTAVIAVEIGLRLLYYKIEFQQAFFLLILAPEFYIPLRMLGLRFHAGMNGTSAARQIYAILELEGGEEKIEHSAAPQLISTLSFSNVSFTYPDESTPALKNISFEIEKGQKIALVGASGAGKSTLANLLLRFSRPSAGQVRIDDLPLEEIPASAWREQIAWVPQKPFIFNTTIAENIRLANPNADMDSVQDAAKNARLHDFIISLPKGYETRVGEAGSRLSGGEMQRLALARAYLKDAPILILDEPTSSLDPVTELALEESTKKLLEGRTVITIAHRLNTIFEADKILVLEKGKLVEQGTHEELIARGGVYAGMVGSVQEARQEASVQVAGGRRQEASKQVVSVKPSNLQPLQHANMQLATSHIFTRLLGFLRGSWGDVALATLIGAGTIASSIALIGTSSWLIASAALHPSIAELQVAIVGVRFFGISRGVFRYMERLKSHQVTFSLLARLRTWFYSALEPLAPARLMRYRSGDLLSRIVSDVDTLENFYIRVVSPPLVALIISLGASAYLGIFYAPLGWTLFGFLLAVGVILPLITEAFLSTQRTRISRRKDKEGEKKEENLKNSVVNHGKSLVETRAALNVQLVDGIQGLSDLLAFGRASAQKEKIAQIGAQYSAEQKHEAQITSLHSGFSLFLTNLGMWTVLFLAIPAVNAGILSGVMLATVTMIALVSFEAVAPLPLAMQMLGQTNQAARRLFEIVDAEGEIREERVERREKGEGQSPIYAFQSAKIEFSNLSFAYPENNQNALQDISFEIQAGQSLAVVGASGAGKSTLMNLLLRFWEYEQGEILLAGKSLHDLPEDRVRAQIAVIPQKAYFFNTSVRENLLLARPAASEAEMIAAAKGAQIHDFIASLPDGYETLIGEQGFRLSGGERQRLAIARAILKDAPILIMDEPTANLDPLTEQDVLNALFALMREKTSLLITHRLIGLENVDEIIVLDRGKIVQRGTQAEITREAGLFGQMLTIQNRIQALLLGGMFQIGE